MVYHNSVKLAKDFYCYVWQGRGNNCNAVLLSSVLRGERPHILVDPGHVSNELGEPCFDSQAQAMERDGFTMGSIGLVIGTHSHPDHIEAAESVVEQSGALFTQSREEDEFYRNVGKMFFQAFGAKPPQIDPFFYLEPGDLTLGAKDDKLAIKVLLTPGHSPGHQSFEVKLANSGVFLLTIDAAYTTDHWNEKALPGFLSSAVETVRSVKKLHHIANRSDATVVTGHDPDAWPSFNQSPAAYD